MKKLITIMSLVTCLATSQAAIVMWRVNQADPIKNLVGDAFAPNTELTVYLLLAANQSAIEASIKNGTFTGDATGIVASNTFATEDNNFEFINSPNSSLLDPVGGEFTLVALILYTFEGDDYYQFSTSRTDYSYASGSDPLTGFSFNRSNWVNGWTPVPEPASALLGLAGIGLLIAQKRKRA